MKPLALHNKVKIFSVSKVYARHNDRNSMSPMKTTVKIFLVAVFVGLISTACGSFNPNSNIEVEAFPFENINGIDVKEHIRESLKIMYPNIGKYKLENELDGHKSLFYMGSNYFKVSFDSKGNWEKSKVESRFTRSINDRVRDAIRQTEFKDWKIINKELEEKVENQEYKFAFQKEKEVYELKFDGSGRLVKKEKTTIQYLQ